MNFKIIGFLLSVLCGFGMLVYGFISLLSYVDVQTLKTVPEEVLWVNEVFIKQVLCYEKATPIRRMLPKYWEDRGFWSIGKGCGDLFFVKYQLDNGKEIKLCTSYNLLKVVGFKGPFPSKLIEENGFSGNALFNVVLPILRYLNLPEEYPKYKIIENEEKWEIEGLYLYPDFVPEIFSPRYYEVYKKDVEEFCKEAPPIRCINLIFSKNNNYLEFSTNLESVLHKIKKDYEFLFNIHLSYKEQRKEECQDRDNTLKRKSLYRYR